MKALEFGLMPGGLFRTGESIQERDFQSRWQSFQDAAATTFSPRGIGWQSSMYGTPYTPPQTRDTSSRPRFLFQTLCSYVQNFLLLDIVESAFGFVPGITTPQGRTIFFANLSPLPRYAVSTTIHILTGAWFMLTYQMIYDLVTLVAVGVFGQRSDAWPPVFDRPWAQYSVHAFWAKGWHQLLRQTLLIAAYPSTWLFGRTGLVFGVFLASGLFHDWAMYCMGRGRDGRVIVFFGAQAVALMLEALWKKVMGKRVGGWFGGIWTAVWIVGLGQMFSKSSKLHL